MVLVPPPNFHHVTASLGGPNNLCIRYADVQVTEGGGRENVYGIFPKFRVALATAGGDRVNRSEKITYWWWMVVAAGCFTAFNWGYMFRGELAKGAPLGLTTVIIIVLLAEGYRTRATIRNNIHSTHVAAMRRFR